MAGADSLERKYEFLDHTADVQIHAWGDNLMEAFQNAAVAMMAYITDIEKVQIQDRQVFEVEGDDLTGLLYRFLDEVLFLFNADPFFLSKKVQVLEYQKTNHDDGDSTFKIKAECFGETWALSKHCQGTEIKAITYSAMNVIDTPEKHEVYFIVDI